MRPAVAVTPDIDRLSRSASFAMRPYTMRMVFLLVCVSLGGQSPNMERESTISLRATKA